MGGMDDSGSDVEHYASANETIPATNKTTPKTTSPVEMEPTTSPKKTPKKAKKPKNLSFSSDDEDADSNIMPPEEDDFTFTRTPKRTPNKTTSSAERVSEPPLRNTSKEASSPEAARRTPKAKQTATDTTMEVELESPSKETSKKARKRRMTFDPDSHEAEPVEKVKSTPKEKKAPKEKKTPKEKATSNKPAKERASKKTKSTANDDDDSDAVGVAPKGHKRAIDITADRRRSKISKPVEYKTGPLTTEEAQSLNSAIESYKRRNNLDDRGLTRTIWDDSKKRYDNIWTELRDAIPDRSRSTVYRRIRTMFPMHEKREWTTEDDDQLTKLHEMMPGKWRQLGEELDRNPEDVRDRWRNHIIIKGKSRKVGKSSWSTEEEKELEDIVRDALEALGKLKEGDDPRDFSLADAGLTLAMVAEQLESGRDRIQLSWKWNKMQEKWQEEKATGVVPKRRRKTQEEIKKEREKKIPKSKDYISDSDVASDVDLNEANKVAEVSTENTKQKRKHLGTNNDQNQEPRAKEKVLKKQKVTDTAPQQATPERSPDQETSERTTASATLEMAELQLEEPTAPEKTKRKSKMTTNTENNTSTPQTKEIPETQLEEVAAPQNIPKKPASAPSEEEHPIDTTEAVQVPSSQSTELTEKERRKLEKRERKRLRKEQKNKQLSEIEEVPETQPDPLSVIESLINDRKVDTKDIDVADATEAIQDELAEKERRSRERRQRKRKRREIEAQVAQFVDAPGAQLDTPTTENVAEHIEAQDVEMEDTAISHTIKEKKERKRRKRENKAQVAQLTDVPGAQLDVPTTENVVDHLETEDTKMEETTVSHTITEKKKKKHAETTSILEIAETQLLKQPELSPTKVVSNADLTPEERAQSRRENKERKAQRVLLAATEAYREGLYGKDVGA